MLSCVFILTLNSHELWVTGYELSLLHAPLRNKGDNNFMSQLGGL